MDDIHNSNITKVPSDLITVNIDGITAEYVIEKYAYAHSIDIVMLPESVVLREKTTNLVQKQHEAKSHRVYLYGIKDNQTSSLSQIGKFYCTKNILSCIYYESNYYIHSFDYDE